MASTITAGNATNGLAISADNTGILQLKTGTGAGTVGLTIDASQNVTFAGTASVATGALYPLVSGTAVASTSGTSIDFTGIPATAKRITVLFFNVSTSGTSLVQLQLGTSGGFVTTGYASGATRNASASTSTTGLLLSAVQTAADAMYVTSTISLITGTSWVQNGLSMPTNLGNGSQSGGGIALGGVLDRIRVTTVAGTDTFDAGSINLFWE